GNLTRDDLGEPGWPELCPEALPHLLPERHRAVGRGDAEQAHAPQDEREDTRLQIRRSGHADARDLAPRRYVPDEAGQQLAADVVDRAAETRGFERPRAEAELLRRFHLVRAQ